jgi:tyrosinase
MALRCRKNQATLTTSERARYVAAVLGLKASGKYDQYVQQHMNAMNDAHRGPAFFPWHREFLRRFELDLQAIDASVTLPYWNWTVDNSGTSSIWNDDFMGGNGRPSDGQVMNGPFRFASGNWTLAFDGPALRRRFGVSAPALPTAGDVTTALAETVYDVPPYSTASTSGWRNRCEGWISGPQLHNLVHVWVGGSMGPMSSPNDPVFFLHHCFVDKLWSDWMRMHPGSGYIPVSGAPPGHNLGDAMQPWAGLGSTVTPASVLDHHALGYAYDTEPECRPKLKFFDDPIVTLKFRDDRKLKFIDDPIVTLKFRDDRKLKFIDDPKGKFQDDPVIPWPGQVDPGPRAGELQGGTAQGGGQAAGAAPFVLATPHHSRAWQQAQGQADPSTMSDVEATLAEYEATLTQWEQARQQGVLTAEELRQLDAMCQEYQALVAEYRQMR